jgi:hypothetical protein
MFWDDYKNSTKYPLSYVWIKVSARGGGVLRLTEQVGMFGQD